MLFLGLDTLFALAGPEFGSRFALRASLLPSAERKLLRGGLYSARLKPCP
jgi:hypothetical protein